MKKLQIKLRVLWYILTNRYDHFIILNIDRPNLEKLLSDENFEVEAMYKGLVPYVFHTMIKHCAKYKDDIELALDKAQFEADAVEYKSK